MHFSGESTIMGTISSGENIVLMISRTCKQEMTTRDAEKGEHKMTGKLRMLALLLALCLTAGLCACGAPAAAPASQSAPETAAPAAPAAEEAAAPAPQTGEYKGYSLVLDGHYLIWEDLDDFSVTLAADGTGYLDWGEDNRGPISSWTAEGETVEIRAGVSVMNGTIRDGVMLLDLEEGFVLCFAKEGADTSAMERITTEQYIALTAEKPAAELPVEGDYTLYAMRYNGQTASAEELQMDSSLTLRADGTGSMRSADEEMELTWSLMDGTLTITMADESSADAQMGNGIAALDIYGDGSMLLYYAQAGADTSSIQVMSMDEIREALESEMGGSRVNMVWRGTVEQDSTHLKYDRQTEGLDALQHYEVYSRGGEFCSCQTTEVSGREQELRVFFRDGKAYNLYPEKMTGSIAATTDSAAITDNVLMLDPLYAVIFRYARQTEFTEETRDFNGISCTAAVYPATEYTPETVFFFDEADRLVGVVEGKPVVDSALEIGETVYTVYGIDDQIVESLFDISGYTIS